MINILKYGFVLFVLSQPAAAEVLVPVMPRDQVEAFVQLYLDQDPSSRIYTYTYEISNSTSSAQRISTIAFEIAEDAKIFNETVPEGWSFGRYVSDNLFGFASTEGITEAHVHYLPNGGHEIRSPYDIAPGATLRFSFQTFTA